MSNLALIQQFNNGRGERQTIIRKALTSATNVGEAMIPQTLEKIITNTLARLSPEAAVIEPEYGAQKLHEYNQLSSLPAAGGAMGEGATTPTRNATYARKSVTLKVLRRKGTVTNFLQDASKNYIDAAAVEMENHLLAHIYDFNSQNLWGSELADAYAWGGVDRYVASYRINEALGGVVPTTLKFLDDMIDNNLALGGANHKKVFLMSPRMQSLVSRLLTNVRLQQAGTPGFAQVEVSGGWRLAAYRDIPIIPTSAMFNKGKMGTVTATVSGGTGCTGDWDIYVAPVTWDGEQEAFMVNTTSISNKEIALTWAAYTNALYYKIYACVAAAGTPHLTRVISAWNYVSDAPTTAVTGYTFTADPTVADATVNATGSYPQSGDHPLTSTGGIRAESVVLWDLDKFQGMGKIAYSNQGGSRFNGIVTMYPLAITDDNIPFMIKSYAALVPAWEATSCIHRGLRVS